MAPKSTFTSMLLARSALVVVFATFATSAWADDAAPASSASTPVSSDDDHAIIVSARKVKERLEDVPVAITALGGERLRQMDHIRIEDLNQLAPSTNVVVTNGHQASYTIRGLGANPGSDGLESSAGVFLDGIYLGRPGMAAMDFIDVQQIEVLRGPQGTLFGKNTTAGAVNITTQQPQFTPGLVAQASIGNYGYQQYQMSVTGPITDTLAARLTAYDTTRDGDVDNITTGKKTGTIGRSGVRGQLLFKPNDNLTVRLIGEYTREQQSAGALAMITSPGASYTTVQKKLAAVGGILAIDPNGQTTAADGGDRTGTRQTAGSAEINWKVGGFTITSLSAYRHWSYHSYADSDLTSADAFNGGYAIQDKQWSEELRVAFPHSKHFDAIVGAYYFGQRLSTDLRMFYGPDAAAWLTGIPNSQLAAAAQGSPTVASLLPYNNSRWDTWANPRTDSFAGFGQGTWHITPRWNITGGVRVTYEKKSEEVWRPNPTSRATGSPIAALASQAASPVRAQTSGTAPSFLVSTDYHVMPGLMVYGLVSRGQKAGGLNTSLPIASLGTMTLVVRPETATNYEVGVKADLFQHRLAFNLSLYRMDVHDYQATYLEAVNGATVQFLTNVGNVRSQGAEADATMQLLKGLSLHGFVGYTDAKYRSYTNAPCPVETAGQSVCDLTGRPVAGAPKWTMGLDGNYEHDVGDRITAYLSAEYSWRSHYYGALDDSKYSITGGYGLLNLRLGLRSKTGPWDISLWGKNITNKHYVANYLNYSGYIPGVYAAFFGDPATYGVTLRTHF